MKLSHYYKGDLANILLPLLICLLFFPKGALAYVSPNVPINHWSYGALDKLIGMGLIDSSLTGTRPFSRMEMGRLIGEALTNYEKSKTKDKITVHILSRLKKEFRDELIRLKYVEGHSASSFLKPLEDPYIRFVYGDKHFELENRHGDEFSKFSNYRLGLFVQAKLWDHLSFLLHPELKWEDWEDGDREWEAELEVIEGYIKLNIANIEIEVGRDSLWWGAGHHGAWLMTNNAKPFDMIKISTPRPVLLPWIFKYLGPFKLAAFWTELEADRDVSEPELLGLRINFKPHPSLEIGISRIVMMGGEGREEIDYEDYWEVFIANKENEPGKLNNNQLGGIDFSLRIPHIDKVLPLANSITLYGDIAGEDEAGGLPSRTAYLGGIYLGNLFLTGRTDLRFEYAENHIPNHPDYWYSHNVYTSGYTYEGRIIGHHMGTDAEDIFVRLTHYLTEDLLLGLAFDREERELSSDVKEIKDYWELDLSFLGFDDIELKAGYRYEYIDNFNFNQGDKEENHIITLETVYDF